MRCSPKEVAYRILRVEGATLDDTETCHHRGKALETLGKGGVLVEWLVRECSIPLSVGRLTHLQEFLSQAGK